MNILAKYASVALAFCAIAGGCTANFEEFNRNPYQPTSLPTENFFPKMFDALASPEENPCQRNNTFWSCFGGYVTAPNSWNRNTLFATFNVDDDWNKWTVNYYFSDAIYPSWFQVARQTDRTGYNFQMAQLLRIYVMSGVASLQGPLPYTKIADGNFYVEYDDEQTAWKAMFDDLDAAIAEIRVAASSGSRPLSSVDRVYAGDNAKWLKFANTLKLRMAMRISSADPEYARRKAEEAVADGVMTNVSESAYDNLNGRYRNGYYQVGRAWGGEVKANACITSYMNGYSDPRRSKYFTEYGNGGGFTGVRSGIQRVQKSYYEKYSGLIYENEDKMTAPMPVMYACEAAFLRAEGALKGWNMGGTAGELYNEAIRLSFEEWGAEGVEDYLADAESLPGSYTDPENSSYSCTNKSKATVAWDESLSEEKKLEKIITQKWIANYPNSLEGWSDFRRTGYPYLFPPVHNLSTVITNAEHGQRRLRFSEDEYNNNGANTKAAVQMLNGGKDTDGAELWWATSENKY